MIRGYHEYKHICSINDLVNYEREPGNGHSTHTVAMKKTIKGEIKIVGHIPKRFLLYVQSLSGMGVLSYVS